MSGLTIDTSYVYRLVSDLRENKSYRYIRRETDADMNEYYVTIYDVDMVKIAQDVRYIITVSPIKELSTTLASQIVFYQVYVNPSTTELIVTTISNATPLSFSISNSLIYLFYNNTSYGLKFTCPYTNITGCKEAILSLFTYPCFIVMLYGHSWLQFSYIQNAYEPVLSGSLFNGQFFVHNSLDYNNTFVVNLLNQPQTYWNSNRFASTNQVPYISYTTSGSTSTTLVTGFSETYIIQVSGGTGVDKIAISSTDSLNIPSGSEIKGIQYSSLSLLVPLKPTVVTDMYLKYYLSGVAGIGFSGSMYATIQEVNLLNSNNVYNSISALIVPVASNTGLNQYQSTTFYYLYDPNAMTLTVWVSATEASFYEFLKANQATIITSDILQLSNDKLKENVFNDVFVQNFINSNKQRNNIKMGCFICAPGCSGPCNSCVTPSTLISMADGTKKPIKDIQQGDLVLSGKTGLPVKVLVPIHHSYTSRDLWSINDMEPFMSTEHCIIDPENDSNHLTISSDNMFKHECISTLSKGKSIRVHSMHNNTNNGFITVPTVKINYTDENHPEEELYDMLTEDYSFIANNLCVFSSFPEIEKHPFVTLFIAILLQKTFMKKELESGTPIQQIRNRMPLIFQQYGVDAVLAARVLIRDKEFVSALPLFFVEAITPMLQETQYIEMVQTAGEYYDQIKSLQDPSDKDIVEILLGLDTTTDHHPLDLTHSIQV